MWQGLARQIVALHHAANNAPHSRTPAGIRSRYPDIARHRLVEVWYAG